MKIDHINEFLDYIPQKTTLSWVNQENKTITLKFGYVVDAVYSKEFDMVVILDKDVLRVFNPLGEFGYVIEIPKTQGYGLKGINQSYLSSSSVTLLMYPNKVDGNEWGDVYQFEVDLKKRAVTKKVGIYR